jgi:nitroreductase
MKSPEPIAPARLLGQLSWRYAVKLFDSSRAIPDDQWAALEQALILSPSSYGLQPWKFLVIRDPDVRQRLAAKSMGQRKVADSSQLVVFAARTDITELDISRWVSRLAELRNVPEADLISMHTLMSGDLVTGARHDTAAAWAKNQTYLALGLFLTSAAAIGIDTCPMEGFESQSYDDILGLGPLGYTATVVATAGYRSPDDHAATEPKARYTEDEVIIRY